MRKFYLCILITISAITTNAQTWNWAVDIGKYFVLGEETVVRTNDAGEIFTTGTFRGSGTIGDTSWYVDTTDSWARGNYVARLTADNELIWAQFIGGFNTVMYDLVVDANNNTYVLGRYAINFVLSDTSFNDGSSVIFIIAYDETGERQWMKLDSVYGAYGNYLALDNTGNLIYAYSNQFNSTIGVRKISAATGTTIWSETFASNASRLTGVAVNSANDIYLIGVFGGDTVYFDSNVYTHDTGYVASSFLARLDASGTIEAVEIISGAYGVQFDLDANDNIYLYGTFSEQIKLRQYTMPVDTCVENNCEMLFLAKLNTTSTASWLRLINDDDIVQGHLDVSEAGDVYISASLHTDTVTFDAVTLVEDTNRTSVFIVKFNTNGVAQWGAKDGGTYITSVYSLDLAVNNVGNVYLTGHYHNNSGDIWFGNDTLPQTGFVDNLFLASLTDNQITAIAESVTAIKSLTVFPNPNSGTFSIRTNGEGEGKITVRTMTGKEVYSTYTREHVNEMHLETLSKGMYLMEAEVEGRKFFEKILIQ